MRWLTESRMILPTIESGAKPATWAMMLLGFGGLGAVLRTRRRFGAGLAAAVRT